MKWHIEEIDTGSKTESSFIVIYPDITIDDLANCCKALYSENLKAMRVLIDTRTPVNQTQSFLGVITQSMPNVEITTRFAHPFVIALVLYLWRQMRLYCKRRPYVNP